MPVVVEPVIAPETVNSLFAIAFGFAVAGLSACAYRTFPQFSFARNRRWRRALPRCRY